MPLTVVLAVGLDSWPRATQTRVWRSTGYFVVSAESIGEAIDLFNDGDFDLVVLGHHISIEDKERLTSLIRLSGAQTPVAFIGNSSRGSDWIADSMPKNDSTKLLTWLRGLLADQAKMRALRTTLHGGWS